MVGSRMLKYVLHTVQPSEVTKGQVATLTGTYAADLHRYDFAGIRPTNCLLDLYQHFLAWEVMAYLDRIGIHPEAPTELITAHDDDGAVLGYVLYLPVPSHPDACGLTYMVVHHQHRRQGIAREMIGMVRGRYPHVELTCTPIKAPFYQELGFRMLDWSDTQLVMNTRNYSCEGLMAIQNVSSIYESPQAKELQAHLLNQYGERAVYKDRKRLKKHIAEAERRAKAYYLANAGRPGAIDLGRQRPATQQG